ncbi:TetR/AcrR family transcriptional regulator [Pseudonocardia acaciae]|uniref:TetR/AcrR family transcriptional regulator n=1 Tax=Pseudonocardia acaciae TaxID=551276 RepID=UPI000562FA8A|nr:TetR/AcrR family transcriptional regulator [Pseudonocardia acaciae]
MSPRPRRRTQAERRATTRAALLEACAECLLENGYAGLTTAAVVARAGVSRGAQAHHFSTKAELVVAALRHVSDQLAAEIIAELPSPPRGVGEAQLELLDQLWRLHTDRLFPALMELWLAARTDPELRAALGEFEHDLTRRIVAFCHQRAPELADRPEFGSFLATVLAALRGLAILDFLDRGEELAKLWPGVRAQLRSLVT